MADAKDTAARFVAAFNAHDEGALLGLNAADIKFSAPGGVQLNNTADATAYAKRWFRAFPNGRMTVRNEISSGPWVIQEITLDGTHSGPLEGPTGTVRATHKKFSGKCVQLLRIDDGHIAESRLYFDQVEMLTQLGLMPMPAAV